MPSDSGAIAENPIRLDGTDAGEVLRCAQDDKLEDARSPVILSAAKNLSRSVLVKHLAVYLVADPDHTSRSLISDFEAALDGGVTCVQLRAKRLTDREVLQLARELARRCKRTGALFVVNDRLDLAL